jgi:hypothetical protein
MVCGKAIQLSSLLHLLNCLRERGMEGFIEGGRRRDGVDCKSNTYF